MVGNILITLALIASVFSFIMYYLSNRGYDNTIKYARIGYHIMAVGVIVASALLLNAIITHQYQYKYVYNYSSDDLPFGLLMSTFYAGQEGSFMLWVLFSAIVGLVLLEYTSKRGDLENRAMMIFTLVTSFLLLMVSPLFKTPFAYIWTEATFIEIEKINPSYLSLPFLQNFLFTDQSSNKTLVQLDQALYSMLSGNGISINNFIVHGKGLNPLLQNFWMQIHPPFLFIGFAMSAVPFVFAISALIKNEYKDWVKHALPWALAGMMVLGFAIMLGGYWAYGVLGWGGYWGWDPVENSSLVPWIIGIALIHTLLIQKKTTTQDGAGRYVKTNLILAIMTFVMVLYSTFLTRSGVLGDASVHSFVDPGMAVYLLLIIFAGTFALMGIGFIAYRWKFLEKNFQGEDSILSRELALFTGSVTLIASAIIIIAGTSAPLFGTTVDISFYNELNLPLAIIIGLLNGISLLIKWKITDTKNLWDYSKYSIIGTIIISAIIIFFGKVYAILPMIFVLAAVFTLIVNLEIAVKIFNKKRTHLGAYVAHAGIALFMLGVVATGNFTESKQVMLPKGETKNVLGYNLTFKGYTPFENGKKYAFNIDVQKDGSSSTISPVMFIAEFNNSLMREPDIWSRFTKDFYISPINYDNKAGAGDTQGNQITMQKGESVDVEGVRLTFESFNFPKDAMASMQEGKDFFIGARLVAEVGGKKINLEPKMQVSNGQQSFTSEKIAEANISVKLNNLVASGTINITVAKLDGSSTSQSFEPKEVLSIEASIKPFISLVWAGVLVMTAGFLISTFRRTKESK
mgnify:CR=1 FL=1